MEAVSEASFLSGVYDQAYSEIVPTAQMFHEKLKEVTENLTTIPYPLAENCSELVNMLKARFNHHIKEETLTNKTLSLIEYYHNKLENLCVVAGLIPPKTLDELSTLITAKRLFIDEKSANPDNYNSIPEFEFVIVCNEIIGSILPPVRFPQACFIHPLQRILELANSFISSLDPFEKCERYILMASFQDLFYEKIYQIHDIAELINFPETIEKFKDKIAAELNSPLPKKIEELLFLEVSRVVMFKTIPKKELPFPASAPLCLNFEILNRIIHHGGQPTELTLNNKIPLVKQYLDEIIIDSPFAMRKISFTLEFLENLYSLYKSYKYEIHQDFFYLHLAIETTLKLTPSPCRISPGYSEYYIRDTFRTILELITPDRFSNFKLRPHVPSSDPDSNDPLLQEKVISLIKTIRDDLEKFQKDFESHHPSEHLLLKRRIQSVFLEYIPLIYQELTKKNLKKDSKDSSVKQAIRHEYTELTTFDHRTHVLPRKILALALTVFSSKSLVI